MKSESRARSRVSGMALSVLSVWRQVRPHRYLVAVTLVAAVTAVSLLTDAGFAAASLLLLGAVLLSSLRGRRAGLVAALIAFAALTFLLSDSTPTSPFREDFYALAAFVAVAAVVGTVQAHNYALRVKAERREREALVRLDLLQRQLAGEPPEAILAGAAEGLVGLFDLAACTVSTSVGSSTAFGEGQPVAPVEVRTEEVEIQAVPRRRRPLSQDDRTVIAAFAGGLATTVANLRLEVEAREARIAEAVSRTRSGFLSLVSHNLRTPLSAIMAAVGMLQASDPWLPEPARSELRDTIHVEADRLERLVAKVLDLSRVRAGGLELDAEPADLLELAHAATRRLATLSGGREFRVDAVEPVPELWLDVVMMEQVFLNVLENALRVAPADTSITIEARQVHDAGRDEVHVEIADRGPGIPEADRQRVFDEFYTTNSRRDAASSGLGLAIVRAVVNGHGGRVWAAETAGGGATIAFRLPLAHSAVGQSAVLATGSVTETRGVSNDHR